jgi:hypothetical protein
MTSAKKFGVLILILAVVFAAAGTTACKKKAAAPAQAEVQKPANEFEGTVKMALGKYMYLPTAQGFDIALQGFDAATLIGKDVRVKGELLTDKPSMFRADSVEVKSGGTYSNVYTRTQDLVIEDFIDVKAREAYQTLTLTSALKPEEWEGKGQAKIYGRLQQATVKEGGVEKPITYVVVYDNAGKEVGKVIVDSLSDFAKYYLAKLKLFENFWFYVNVKESVDKKIRPRTKELFHADVLMAGLF